MRTSIDKAGRLVIPRALRDRLGLVPGEVAAITGKGLERTPEGWLVIPSTGTPLTVEEIRALRLADQR